MSYSESIRRDAMSKAIYRINYTIEKAEAEEPENFKEIGRGTSGRSVSVTQALRHSTG